MDANKDLKGGIAVYGVSINNLRFADDIDLIEASSSSLQEVAQLLNEGSYASVGQNEKQTVKYATNSELKRMCYKEPSRGNSDYLAT